MVSRAMFSFLKVASAGFLFLGMIGIQNSSWAGGAIAVNKATGTPLVHPNPTTIQFNPDPGPIQTTEPEDQSCGLGAGGCGGSSIIPIREARAAISTNGEAVGLAVQGWNVWNNPNSGANVNVTLGSALSEDVTACNANDFIDFSTSFSADGCDPRMCGNIIPKPACCTAGPNNPVIFDANGDIVADLLGENNRTTTLAFAGPIPFPAGSPTQFAGFNAVINGVCLEDTADDHPSCGSTRWTNEILISVMTHEFGHALGLDHTQVNPQAINVFGVGDASIKPGFDLNQAVPTMYPFLVTGPGDTIPDLTQLKGDDLATIRHLYPPANFTTNFCRVTGGVFNTTTSKGLRGVEVVVRPQGGGPTSVIGAISTISGAEVPNSGLVTNTQPTNNCSDASGLTCGNYVIDGLQIGTTYSFEINPVNEFFTEGSRFGPCDPPLAGFSTVISGTVTCNAGGGITLTPANANNIQTSGNTGPSGGSANASYCQ